VQVVVESDVHPDKLTNTLKSYASRHLNQIEAARKRWARHEAAGLFECVGVIREVFDVVWLG
jgi:hypothetical protein